MLPRANNYKIFIAFFLIMLFILVNKSSVAQSINEQRAIDQQNRTIRNQQKNIEQQKRQEEFIKIKEERERLKKQEEEIKTQNLNITGIKECFPFKTITYEGANLLTNSQKQLLTLPLIGKCFDEDSLNILLEQTKNTYHDLGYITVQVTVPAQNIRSGHIKVDVIEGKIAKIIIDDDSFGNKLKKTMAFGNLEGKTLNIKDINQGISQINRLASVNSVMKVEPSTQTGKSNIIVNTTKKFPAQASISYNNLGNDFSGMKQTTFSGSFDNLLSLNDNINFSSTLNLDDDSREKDIKSFSGNFSIPLAYNTISYSASRTSFRGLSELENSMASLTGFSNNNSLDLERLWLNNTNTRISSNLSLTTKRSGSYINNNKIDTSAKRLSIANLSFTFNKFFDNGINFYIKPQYAKGLRMLSANKDQGRLNADIPRAQFDLYKIYASAKKRFNIPKTNITALFNSEFEGQAAKDTLYGSEQISIGGYHSVRGFRENYINGDHGYYIKNKISLNLGQIIAPIFNKTPKNKQSSFVSKNLKHLHKFTIEPFFDYGSAQAKHNSYGGRLSGAGIKTIFNSQYFTASITYATILQKSQIFASSPIKENNMLYFQLTARCC